jgi:hypothetical protein
MSWWAELFDLVMLREGSASTYDIRSIVKDVTIAYRYSITSAGRRNLSIMSDHTNDTSTDLYCSNLRMRFSVPLRREEVPGECVRHQKT